MQPRRIFPSNSDGEARSPYLMQQNISERNGERAEDYQFHEVVLERFALGEIQKLRVHLENHIVPGLLEQIDRRVEVICKTESKF